MFLRCIAVCSLGLWVCEELMQKNIHHQVKDAINVLGVTLKVSDPLRGTKLHRIVNAFAVWYLLTYTCIMIYKMQLYSDKKNVE